MNELFQKLLEAEILTEDTKNQLEEAINAHLDEAAAVAKAEATETVRTELTEQWITERDALIEAVDTKVGEFLGDELDELKGDISRFRDLEAESAEKLVEAKEDMKTRLEGDIQELVEKLDAFLEVRLNAEVEELKEDIEDVKKIEFGRQLFEGFVKEYRSNFIDNEGVETELNETRKALDKSKKAMTKLRGRLDEQVRTAKLSSLLKPLSGKQKDIMESILDKLPTEQLEEGYKTFIGRVVKRDVDEKLEESKKTGKEDKVLAEDGSRSNKKESKKPLKEGVSKVGDGVPTLIEEGDDPAEKERIAYLQHLAGIK